MSKKLSVYYTDDNRGHCELYVDYKDEMFYLKYFDDNGKQFFTEEFPNKSMRYVEDAAENWAMGIRDLPTKENVV